MDRHVRSRFADGEDVEGRDRPLEPLERERADRFHHDIVLDLGKEPLLDQTWSAVASSASLAARFVTVPIAA